MKKAVIFYSLSGNTKAAAKVIADKLSAELIQIDTKKPMPTSMGKQMMLGGMQSTFGICPKIKGVPENIADYDQIILGTPIWAGKVASPVNTLIKKYGIADKITSVFTFSGGGDNDKCILALNKLLKNMNNNIALADKANKMSERNEERIQQFVDKEKSL